MTPHSVTVTRDTPVTLRDKPVTKSVTVTRMFSRGRPRAAAAARDLSPRELLTTFVVLKLPRIATRFLPTNKRKDSLRGKLTNLSLIVNHRTRTRKMKTNPKGKK